MGSLTEGEGARETGGGNSQAEAWECVWVHTVAHSRQWGCMCWEVLLPRSVALLVPGVKSSSYAETGVDRKIQWESQWRLVP